MALQEAQGTMQQQAWCSRRATPHARPPVRPRLLLSTCLRSMLAPLVATVQQQAGNQCFTCKLFAVLIVPPLVIVVDVAQCAWHVGRCVCLGRGDDKGGRSSSVVQPANCCTARSQRQAAGEARTHCTHTQKHKRMQARPVLTWLGCTARTPRPPAQATEGSPRSCSGSCRLRA